MSFLPVRASKRLALSTTTPSRPWICTSCRRTLTTTSRSLQQQQQSTPNKPTDRPTQAPKPEDETTHFGYTTLPSALKASRVASVFSSVASSYDTMNDLMSLGIHRLWKDHFVRSLNPGVSHASEKNHPGQKILDIAGGTGDIAQRMLDHATQINNDDLTSVIVSDINPQMLTEGKKRLSQTPYAAANRLEFLEANAEDLHTIPDASIDLYTVAFGIRNFTHKQKALDEAFRVLKPGGVFACLEFCPNLHNPLLNGVYKRWSFGAIPLIGQVVASDRESYRYLVESIERFPTQEAFKEMIREAGFVIPGEGRGGKGWEDLSFGVAAVHKGVKPVR